MKLKIEPSMTHSGRMNVCVDGAYQGTVKPELAAWIVAMASLKGIAKVRNDTKCGGKCGCCILVDELGSHWEPEPLTESVEIEI